MTGHFPPQAPVRQAVLAEVASRTPVLERPGLVAVDGVDGSGKTTFAHELAAVIDASGRFSVVVRASVDGFHHPRAHRHAHGRTGETFWSRRDDYSAPMRELVGPWRAGPESAYRTAINDFDTDAVLDLPATGGQRIYLTACDPRSRADVVVDNSDLARARIA